MKRRPPGGPSAPPRAPPVQVDMFGTPPPPREQGGAAPLPPEPAPAVVPRTDAKAPAQVEAFAPGAPKPPAAEVTAPPVAAPVAAVPPPPAAAAVPPPAVLSGPVAHAAKPVAEAPKPVAEALRPAARTEAAGASLRKEYPWRTQGAPVAAEAEKPRRVVLSVGELTRQIKDAIEGGFPRVVVRGEVSSFRGANVRGHLYFTLKDQEACLDAKIWASTAARMKFRLREGMEVIAEGSIDLYEPQGRYSLIIQRLEPAGEGALALAFQQLKEKLQAEGLFGDKRIRPPRPLPLLPRRIGVVTSRTGAALQDFLRVLHGRHPRLSVLVCDARVQGEGSAQEVVSAIQRLARTDVDVIVVTRGGGSMEDLWTFNEEIVARAIHACPIPVVSAIGHEVDFTIADFVADLRAPTPSAAAERLAPVLKDLELGLATSERRLHKAAERAVLLERQRLRAVAGRLPDPRRLLAQRRLHLGAQHDKLERGTRQGLRQGRDRLRALVDRLNRLRPQAQLAANREALHRLKARLQAAGRELLRRRREALSRSSKTLERASPMSGLQRKHKALHAAKARLVELQRRRLHSERHDFSRKVATLQALSPLEVMARGYSVTFRRSDGHLVRGAADVKVGDSIAVRLLTPGCSTLSGCDEIDATVTSVKGSPGGNEPPS